MEAPGNEEAPAAAELADDSMLSPAGADASGSPQEHGDSAPAQEHGFQTAAASGPALTWETEAEDTDWRVQQAPQAEEGGYVAAASPDRAPSPGGGGHYAAELEEFGFGECLPFRAAGEDEAPPKSPALRHALGLISDAEAFGLVPGYPIDRTGFLFSDRALRETALREAIGWEFTVAQDGRIEDASELAGHAHNAPFDRRWDPTNVDLLDDFRDLSDAQVLDSLQDQQRRLVLLERVRMGLHGRLPGAPQPLSAASPAGDDEERGSSAGSAAADGDDDGGGDELLWWGSRQWMAAYAERCPSPAGMETGPREEELDIELCRQRRAEEVNNAYAELCDGLGVCPSEAVLRAIRSPDLTPDGLKDLSMSGYLGDRGAVALLKALLAGVGPNQQQQQQQQQQASAAPGSLPQDLQDIEELDLAGHGVGNEAAEALSELLQYLPNLQGLNLARNAVSERGMHGLLPEIEKHPNLIRVSVELNPIPSFLRVKLKEILTGKVNKRFGGVRGTRS